MAEGFREGLFLHCIEDDAIPPLPFNLEGPPGCFPSRDVGELLFFRLFLNVNWNNVYCVWYCLYVTKLNLKNKKKTKPDETEHAN